MEIAAYTSAWYVRHPDGALSAMFALDGRAPADPRPPVSVPVPAAAGKKVVTEGPE
ncbi:hypothetical protein [Actinoplanes sp. NPDC020271]|uniref:hypothetical protein n=1 Tax=Actinoplanes sp. NPDC020271 TaxID=3363896 RepID=UPI0037AC0C29